MLEFIVGFFLIGFAGILQSAVLSRLPLINGMADLLMLLIVGWSIQPYVKYPWIWVFIASFVSTLISSMTIGVTPLSYGLVFIFALFLRQRFWKARLLTMVALSLIGTILVHVVSFIAIVFQGNLFSLSDAFYLVTLPSMLLNLVFAIPVYAITREFVKWIYPEKIEV